MIREIYEQLIIVKFVFISLAFSVREATDATLTHTSILLRNFIRSIDVHNPSSSTICVRGYTYNILSSQQEAQSRQIQTHYRIEINFVNLLNRI